MGPDHTSQGRNFSVFSKSADNEPEQIGTLWAMLKNRRKGVLCVSDAVMYVHKCMYRMVLSTLCFTSYWLAECIIIGKNLQKWYCVQLLVFDKNYCHFVGDEYKFSSRFVFFFLFLSV